MRRRTVAGEHDAYSVRDEFDYPTKKAGCDAPGGQVVTFDEGELYDPFDGHEKKELIFFGAPLGTADLELANGIAFVVLLWSVAFNAWERARALTDYRSEFALNRIRCGMVARRA